MKKRRILNNIVEDYIARFRPRAAQELRWFQIQPTLESAVSLAALAKTPGGKRFSHQRRIPQSVLNESRRRLLKSFRKFKNVRSFEELHDLVRNRLETVKGIGRLTIYDTSVRIAAKLGLEPNVIFLHAGTLVGARRLQLDTSRKFITIDQLPRAFRRLRPREIEDVLCIYKDQLFLKAASLPTRMNCHPKPTC